VTANIEIFALGARRQVVRTYPEEREPSLPSSVTRSCQFKIKFACVTEQHFAILRRYAYRAQAAGKCVP